MAGWGDYHNYKNTSDRTVIVYGRRVKAGAMVDVGGSAKASREAAEIPGLVPCEIPWQNKWLDDELRLLFRMVGWWKLHPWVTQYRVIKALQRSVVMSHRSYASIRTRVYRAANRQGAAYTEEERAERWTTRVGVDDGRLVRGKRVVKEAP